MAGGALGTLVLSLPRPFFFSPELWLTLPRGIRLAPSLLEAEAPGPRPVCEEFTGFHPLLSWTCLLITLLASSQTAKHLWYHLPPAAPAAVTTIPEPHCHSDKEKKNQVQGEWRSLHFLRCYLLLLTEGWELFTPSVSVTAGYRASGT